MPDTSTSVRRLGLGLTLSTIFIAIVATQWPFHYQLTRFGIHRRWDRIDWRWFPRTPMGHLRIDRDLVLNLLMLVPLGIGFALWRRAGRTRIVIEALVLGTVTSSLLELAQLATRWRYTTFADVWRNALGCMVGAMLVVALRTPPTIREPSDSP